MIRWVRTALAIAALAAGPAAASYHTYRVEQVYSNASGTVQFLVLHESQGADGENFLGGKTLSVFHGGTTKSFQFPNNLGNSSCGYYGCSQVPTADTRVLIGTAGFAQLGLMAVDYQIPDGFFPLDGGLINYADVDFVNYSALPTDGVHAITRSGMQVQNLATNFHGASASVAGGAAGVNYEGIWWNAPPGSESGWGINFAHQGSIIFATWFLYDHDGRPWWLIAELHEGPAGVFSGNASSVTGPPYDAVPFDPGLVAETIVGTATVTFSGAKSAQFDYTINAVTRSKQIVLQEFASPVPTCSWGGQQGLALAGNYQDMWWSDPPGFEAGWGINLAHQGDVIFATWFTYGQNQQPWWLILVAQKTGANAYSGTLSTVTGSPYDAATFDPTKSVESEIGTGSLTFTDGNHATFSYSLYDPQKATQVEQAKQITRQVFAAPGTICQ